MASMIKRVVKRDDTTVSIAPDVSSLAMAAVRNHYVAFNQQYDNSLKGRTRFSLDQLLRDTWHSEFPASPFPSGAVSPSVIANAIRYGIVMRGYGKINQQPAERFMNNYSASIKACGGVPIENAGYSSGMLEVIKCENHGINSINSMEDGMNKPTKKKETKVVMVNGEKGETLFGMILRLLLEGGRSDEEIEKMVTKKFPDRPWKRSYISITRADINSGRRGPVPKKPLVRMERIAGELVAAKGKKKTKESPVKAKAAPSVKAPGGQTKKLPVATAKAAKVPVAKVSNKPAAPVEKAPVAIKKIALVKKRK